MSLLFFILSCFLFQILSKVLVHCDVPFLTIHVTKTILFHAVLISCVGLFEPSLNCSIVAYCLFCNFLCKLLRYRFRLWDSTESFCLKMSINSNTLLSFASCTVCTLYFAKMGWINFLSLLLRLLLVKGLVLNVLLFPCSLRCHTGSARLFCVFWVFCGKTRDPLHYSRYIC